MGETLPNQKHRENSSVRSVTYRWTSYVTHRSTLTQGGLSYTRTLLIRRPSTPPIGRGVRGSFGSLSYDTCPIRRTFDPPEQAGAPAGRPPQPPPPGGGGPGRVVGGLSECGQHGPLFVIPTADGLARVVADPPPFTYEFSGLASLIVAGSLLYPKLAQDERALTQRLGNTLGRDFLTKTPAPLDRVEKALRAAGLDYKTVWNLLEGADAQKKARRSRSETLAVRDARGPRRSRSK